MSEKLFENRQTISYKVSLQNTQSKDAQSDVKEYSRAVAVKGINNNYSATDDIW